MTSSGRRQACMGCRRRKVKCDGLPTCSNCHATKGPCQYLLPRKRGPKPVKWREQSPSESPESTSPEMGSSVNASDAGFLVASGTPNVPSESPLSNSVTSPPVLGTLGSQAQTAIQVHLDLLAGLLIATPSHTAASIIDHCIFLYAQYVFGAVPICHEGALRATANRFFISPSGGANLLKHHARIWRCFAADTEWKQIEILRSLALLTALCADVAYVVPDSLLPDKHLIAPLFLRAARDTLSIYQDYDIEHPNSSSLSIRLLLSSAIQHATGKNEVAFHILNEAGLIAMRMRLYDEDSLAGQDPVEECLLRNAFWLLYVCDKTALVMKTRPVTIHEPLFETDLTLKPYPRTSVPLFGHARESNDTELEDRLLEGFHVIRRLWALAARVIQAMISNSRRPSGPNRKAEECPENIAQLSEIYFELITLMNNFPVRVRSQGESSSDLPQGTDELQLDMLQRQRTTYLLNLHSIKVLVLNSAIQCSMTEVIGLSAEPLTLATRQIELAQDFINVLESVPFLHLQVEGEHCAEKIRHVGSLLLELAHGAKNQVVKSQANQCAMRLINMLVRLNSKASDVLGR
ncbi:hypothetical protein BJY01DRAFT_228369 [Aspergillus pseudoustus]|uniref:Zn(2)-C6 fungal-type domain-containing protein n=1 Tax=Aspergillus pseudoustus TaxID=1810923 RepID=A0ABR4INV8_9EURO